MRSNTFVHRTALAAVVASAALLAACAQQGPSSGNPAVTAPVATANTVEGTVTWRERIALPPDAVLVVQLQDTSRADAPAQVIEQQAIRLQNLQPPHNYRLSVDPKKLNPSARYTVTARVTSNGGNTLHFINDRANPVLTQGAGNKVDMMLVRTGS